MNRSSPQLRRGIALTDAIIGGVILAIGLVSLMGLSSRALKQGQRGEQAIIASSLLDELLGRVLAEGPDEFPKFNDTSGRFDPPFDQFSFELVLEDQGEYEPFRVTAYVFNDAGDEFSIETLITAREGEDPNPVRIPPEVIDREGRHDEKEGSY